eukprot:CAMPEP_0182595860 /NCGR_PEP_ID=MMETSP1324-20130603/83094_1 /TAXON_ID=236786 /ORGANISM="Florenciella sp., Strain RCC1587" /LENGTH=92 /DNA_ID=CAMNT_0024813491 /DNA_START=435 /DNA_END=713 /DNA_ORIENTATION=+
MPPPFKVVATLFVKRDLSTVTRDSIDAKIPPPRVTATFRLNSESVKVRSAAIMNMPPPPSDFAAQSVIDELCIVTTDSFAPSWALLPPTDAA